MKEAYEEFLKEVSYNLGKVLNKSVKSIKKVLQELKIARKSSCMILHHLHHAETSQSTRNANKQLVVTKREPKTRGGFKIDQIAINTCNFHNIN